MKDYFKWVIKHKSHNFKLILCLLGIIASAFATPTLLNSDAPIAIIIMSFIAIYGFTVGIFLEPYFIYRKLKKMGELEDDKS